MRHIRLQPSHRSPRRSDRRQKGTTRSPLRRRKLLIEALEDRRMLTGITETYPELPGMVLVDPRPGQFDGQIVYLDFDGAEDVTYNGPVVVEGIDIPAFQAPGELAGQEQEIIASVVTNLEETFAGTGIIFTTDQPAEGTDYSTVYIGGNDSAFEQYGSFLGLAEQLDLGNQDPMDNGFVFTNGYGGVTHPEGCTQVVAATVAHEAGHLVGYAHADHTDGDGPLSHVAANGTATVMFTSAPSAVGKGQLVDIRVAVKLSGNTNGGPWLVEELGIYDSDSLTGGYTPWTTIKWDANPFKIYQQDYWYAHPFSNIKLSDYSDTFDFTDGIELYAEVEINSNTFWGTNVQDQTPIKTVIVDDKGPYEPNADLKASSDTGYSSTDNITKDTTPTFSWSVPNDRYGSRVVQYRYEVGDSSPDRYTTTSTTITYPTSLPNGTHRFYVQAKDEWGNWGDIDNDLSFTIDTSAPGRPSVDLRTSSDSGTSHYDNLTNDNTPTIDFSASSSPYRFWYDVDDSSPDRGPTKGSSWTTHTLSNGNRVIYVQAEDAAGNKSSVGQLTVIIDRSAPTTPSLQKPSNNTLITDSLVDFDWSGGSDSNFDKYELWVDDNSSFTSPTKKSTTSSYYDNLSLGEDRWYWKVFAFDKAGNSSASVTRQFDRVSPHVTNLSFRSGTSAGSSEISNICAGEMVYLRVDAIGMIGEEKTVWLYEDDGNTINNIDDDALTSVRITIGPEGFGTAQWKATWQGDDEDDPFNKYYLWYDKPWSPNNVYSGVPGVGHFLVRPPVSHSLIGKAQYGLLNTQPLDVNQRAAPNDFSDQGASWERLGTYAITGNTLVVELSGQVTTSTFVIADAVRIEWLSDAPALLRAPAGPTTSALADQNLASAEALGPIVDAAVLQWDRAGIEDDSLAKLKLLDVRIVDLPGDLLGAARSDTVFLDRDAAGYGWFVDRTPMGHHDEFAKVTDGNYKAPPASPAHGRMDLLSAVMHEMGHVLGLDDTAPDPDSADVMNAALWPSIRRVPWQSAVDELFYGLH